LRALPAEYQMNARLLTEGLAECTQNDQTPHRGCSATLDEINVQ
jgi:hypothetical protein